MRARNRKIARAAAVFLSALLLIWACAVSRGPGTFHGSGLRETDLFGRFFLRLPGAKGYDGYYDSLAAVADLVESDQWRGSVTGFYINVSEDSGGVRLSYFSASPEDVIDAMAALVPRFGLAETRMAEGPTPATVADRYGGEELRFRRYLTAYTRIGLDIMESDLLGARRLFALFRWQVSIEKKPYKPHFVRTFEGQSPFYNSLTAAEKEQFWKDLASWPEGSEVGWAHLFVNMVLGGDWIGEYWTERYRAGEPLSTPELNDVLRRAGMGFKVPEGWRP